MPVICNQTDISIDQVSDNLLFSYYLWFSGQDQQGKKQQQFIVHINQQYNHYCLGMPVQPTICLSNYRAGKKFIIYINFHNSFNIDLVNKKLDKNFGDQYISFKIISKGQMKQIFCLQPLKDHIFYAISNSQNQSSNRIDPITNTSSITKQYLIQILSYNNMNSLDKKKITVLIITILTSAIMIFLIQLITKSYITASILYLLTLLCLLRLIGSFLLYPGNFFYVRSTMEIRLSQELSAKIVGCFRVLHSIQENIIENKFGRQDCFTVSVDRFLNSIIKMLQMFQSTLSKRKIKLLANFRNLQKVLQEKEEGKPSLFQLISKRRRVKTIKLQSKTFYQSKFKQISIIVKQIDQIIKSFVPPKNIVLYFLFLIFKKNLYQIRFGFNNWAMLNYQLFKVPAHTKNILQTGIIHNLLGHPEPSDKKAVLLCNPNGVFIQFFADHYYVLNYLRLGYHVILWNYRGYGESTGSSTIIKSQQDAYAVYRFYREKGYTIDIVHGYSIGGTAAVGLIERINKNKQKYPEDQVGLLINDRSFSSIGEIPIQFGWLARNITRLIFCDQNIDSSIQFEQAKCKKIILWDSIDQIIPGRSSMKYAIIKRMMKSKAIAKKSNCDNREVNKNQLNQESTFYTHLNQLDFISKKFHQNIKKIVTFTAKRIHGQKQLTIFSQQVSSASTATADKLDCNNFQQLIASINLVDGAGIRLFQDYDLWTILQKHPKQLQYLCESYVMGMICHGSCYPLKSILHNYEQIKSSTLKKIQSTLIKINGKYGFKDSQIQYGQEQSALQIHKNLYVLYTKIGNIILMNYGQEWFSRYGSLLPIRNGHNSSLSLLQTEVLHNFIRSSLQIKREDQQ